MERFFSRGSADSGDAAEPNHFSDEVKALMDENTAAIEAHEATVQHNPDSDEGAVFLVHLETPRGHAGGSHDLQVDLKAAIHAALGKSAGDSMPSNLVVVSQVDLLNAHNKAPCGFELRCRDRKLRGACAKGLDKHTAARGGVSGTANTIVTVPPESTLGDIGAVYTANGFTRDEKFRKYRAALSAGAFDYVSEMMGSSTLVYVPPCATEPRAAPEPASSGDVAIESGELPELAVSTEAEHAAGAGGDAGPQGGDWFIEVMKNNPGAFNHPVEVVELDNPRDPAQGAKILGFQMNRDDFHNLKDMTENQISTKLSEHVYNLDENAVCTLTLTPSAKNEKDGTPVENVYTAYGATAPKHTHAVSMLLRMHVAFF